jgi:hypothetical protein
MGVQNSVLLVVFVVAWLAPAARRLSEFRRGQYSPLKVQRNGHAVWLTLVAGTGPWALLMAGYKLFPAAPLWIPSTLPIWVSVVGVALALVTVAWSPSAEYTRAANSSLFVPRLTRYPQVLTLALLLISGSLVIGIVFLCWLAAVGALHLQRTFGWEAFFAGGSLRPFTPDPGLNSTAP